MVTKTFNEQSSRTSTMICEDVYRSLGQLEAVNRSCCVYVRSAQELVVFRAPHRFSTYVPMRSWQVMHIWRIPEFSSGLQESSREEKYTLRRKAMGSRGFEDHLDY
jgi:hypothetical protein